MKLLFIMSLLLWGISASQSLAQDRERLPLATGEWPPYTSTQMEGYGIVTEITTAVVIEMGMTPDYKFVPWKRAEHMVKNGDAFAAFPYAITPARIKNFSFSDRVLINPNGRFFYRKARFDIPKDAKQLSDLKSYKFGSLAGEASIATLEEAGIRLELVSKDSQNIMRLHAGRVDLILMDELLGWYLIRKLYPNEQHLFTTLDITFEEMINQSGNPNWDSYLMVSPEYPNAKALTKRFNNALKRIKENGVYDDILDKYGLDLSQ